MINQPIFSQIIQSRWKKSCNFLKQFYLFIYLLNELYMYICKINYVKGKFVEVIIY